MKKVYIYSNKTQKFREVEELLKGEGFDVIQGEDIVDRIYTVLPDIIVIDNDGNNNGITVFKRIKREKAASGIPVVFTGIKDDESKIKALLLGALDYIYEPFLTQELFIKLRNFMNISGVSTKDVSKEAAITSMSYIEKKQRKNMLIIDEDPIILSILSSRYTNKGYSVMTSRSGFEAFEILNGNRMDIVITDLVVPGITGDEIVKCIKDKNKAAKVLVLSSQRGEGYIDSALKAGADEYVIKPFSPAELDLRIQRLIG